MLFNNFQVDKAKVTSAESSGESVDKATKIKVLEEESKAIKLEKEAAVCITCY
jgi:hypothetical protein